MCADKWMVDKLDNTNYPTWKFQMKHMLLMKELYDVVDGTEEKPADSADAAVKDPSFLDPEKRFLSLLCW